MSTAATNPQEPRHPKAARAVKPSWESRWTSLLNSEGIYASWLREKTNRKSGVYAFRMRATKEVLYVGESHTNRLWKTAIRHVHAQDSFDRIGEWTAWEPHLLEIKMATCHADKAQALETQWIERLQPTGEILEPVPF